MDKTSIQTETDDAPGFGGLLTEARSRMEEAVKAQDINRERAIDDIKMLDGQHWDENVKKEREEDGRPCLTFNDLPTFIDQVEGDYRKARPRINVIPAEIDTEEENNQRFKNLTGSKDYEVAQVYDGLIRNIEYRSHAKYAYDHGFNQMVSAGFGWWRIVTDYTNERSFDQDIFIKKIPNAMAVYPDPKVWDLGPWDMKYCFISEYMSKDSFESEFPQAQQFELPEGRGEEYTHWWKDNKIRVAEYFVIKKEKGMIRLLSDGRVVTTEDFEMIADELAELGITEVDSREVDMPKVVWYKITGNEILEGPQDFPGIYIPVVPDIGKDLNVDGQTIVRGLIRNSKDAARNYNYWRTATTEIVALAPKTPWVGDAKSVEGYEEMWKNANKENYSFLPYDSQGGKLAAPQRPTMAQIPAGMVNEALQAQDDKKSTMGLFNASRGEKSNEISGKAIIARQQEGDVGTFAFMDNHARAIQYTGEILVNIIPKIYDTTRIMRIRMADGTEDFIRLNQPIVDEETGKEVYLNDLSVGRYDIVVETGPSATTQRLEAVESMMAFIQVFPEAAPVIGDLIAKNLDWPGADVIAKRLEKLVPPEMKESEDDDQEEGEEQQQGFSQEEVLQLVNEAIEAAGLDIKKIEAEAKRMKAMADQVKAGAELAEVETDAADLEEQAVTLAAQVLQSIMTNLANQQPPTG